MSVFRVGLLVFVPAALVLGDLALAENLEAGKSVQKLFASNCSTCHSDPRTLSSRMNNWALTGFLQEHYTASPAAAYELAAYLNAVGNHSPRGKQHPRASGDEPQQSWANQSSAPVERPPQNVPSR
jgi:mono/diheme cytochrome c family protein